MKEISADEVANLVKNGDQVAFGGFTPAGCPKVVGPAIAQRARQEHEVGRPFKIRLLTSASTGDAVHGELARADAILSCTPYQTNNDLRNMINAGQVEYWDMHISHYSQQLKEQIFGPINLAVIEAADVTDTGDVVLTSAVGMAPTFCKYADKIVIELNKYHPKVIHGLHDIYEVALAPNTQPIPLTRPDERIGNATLHVDPSKIVGIIETNLPDQGRLLSDSDEITDQIGQNVAKFLVNEMSCGRIPDTFLPLQSGVGNVGNAVLRAMSASEAIPPYVMYSEVLQDSVIEAIKNGDITFASSTGLAVTPACLNDVYENWDFFKTRLVLRPEEISNNPEVISRLGLIAINTALEADICGNVNSTHVLGSKVMNGIGGSADFCRAARLSIFCCRSTAKDGKISAIVPWCSHIDHSEHSVKVIATEYGVADLRGKGPRERANLVIDNCAHPAYRDMLHEYLDLCSSGHEPFSLPNAFGMHMAFFDTGDMRQTVWRRR